MFGNYVLVWKIMHHQKVRLNSSFFKKNLFDSGNSGFGSYRPDMDMNQSLFPSKCALNSGVDWNLKHFSATRKVPVNNMNSKLWQRQRENTPLSFRKYMATHKS